MDLARSLVNHEGPAVQGVQAQVGQTRADLGQGRIIEPAGADHARQFRPGPAQFGRRRPGVVPALFIESPQPATLGVHFQPGLLLGAGREVAQQRLDAASLQRVLQHLLGAQRRRQVDDLALGARHAQRQREAYVLGPVVEVVGALGLVQETGDLFDPVGIKSRHSRRQVQRRRPPWQLQHPGGDQAAPHVV